MITKTIGEAFRFAISLKRMLPYIATMFVVYSSILYLMLNAYNFLMAKGAASALLPSFGLYALFLNLLVFIVVIIAVALVTLWVNGAMTDQAAIYPKSKKLSASFRYARSKYLTILFATILIGVVSFVVSLFVSFIPIISGILTNLASVVIGLIFFFIYPAIIIGKKSAVDSLKHSYNVFMKNRLEVFVVWLLAAAIALIVIVLFALPAIAWLLIGIISSQAFDLQAIVSQAVLMAQSPYIILFLLIFSIGMGFVAVFSVGVQTKLYMNLKKRPMK